jgi:hypothetical protein
VMSRKLSGVKGRKEGALGSTFHESRALGSRQRHVYFTYHTTL